MPLGIDGEGGVGGGVLDAPHYTTQTCIGASLPLPAGEVAMPLGIDGEGGVGGGVPDAPPYTDGIFFYAAGRPEAVPYMCPLGGIIARIPTPIRPENTYKRTVCLMHETLFPFFHL